MIRFSTTAVVATLLLLLAPLFGVGRSDAQVVAMGTSTPAPGWNSLLNEFLMGTEPSSTVVEATSEPEPTPVVVPPVAHRGAMPASTDGGAGGAASGPTFGAVGFAMLASPLDSPTDPPTGRLFLAEQRLRDRPFASRLFRPPRVTVSTTSPK